MKLTIIYPCLGRTPGRRYVRSWQMEPLPAAHLAGLTPAAVAITFFDDRMEPIDYDRPTDLVAITVETYTAKRSYQIASEYRRRGVPVVMGGFHATLVTDECLEHAEAVVVGEAEDLWATVLADFRAGKLQRVYRSTGRPDISTAMPDRRIFAGKDYLPVGLIEAGRGCPLRCDFCAIQSAFHGTRSHRAVATIVKEIQGIQKKTKLIFFVDDNIGADLRWARSLFEALIPLKIRWVSQATVNMVRDPELLALMKQSGCAGVLIGFESLQPENLAQMNKGFNPSRAEAEEAIRRLHQAGIALYATFVFGYDHDTRESFRDTIDFAIRNKIFMIALNHCPPFPGTPLYARLEAEGKLLYPKWWLAEEYKYGQVPYRTALPPEVIQQECVAARKVFYGPRSILRRLPTRSVFQDLTMLRSYLFINALLRVEASQRENYPLGDLGFTGPLLTVGEGRGGP